MPLSYEIDGKLQQLVPVMDEHAEWYGHVMRQAFYPGQGVQHSPPDSFKEWVASVEGEEFIDIQALERLGKTHAEMHAQAARLIAEGQAQGKPAAASFENFVDIYDEFVLLVRRFERDCVLEDSGLDPVSGLRSRRVMRKDLEREMERRARRGKPFSLALVKIDRYEDIRALQNVDEHGMLIGALGDMIRRCLRSFDDAYRSGDGEFIMSLKHADISGGTSALNRLRKLLEEAHIVFEKDGQLLPLTLSGCVAEPLPGDDLDILLGNMREDLGRYGEVTGTGAALQYHEVSPLKRFIETMQD